MFRDVRRPFSQLVLPVDDEGAMQAPIAKRTRRSSQLEVSPASEPTSPPAHPLRHSTDTMGYIKRIIDYDVRRKMCKVEWEPEDSAICEPYADSWVDVATLVADGFSHQCRMVILWKTKNPRNLPLSAFRRSTRLGKSGNLSRQTEKGFACFDPFNWQWLFKVALRQRLSPCWMRFWKGKT